VTVWVVNRESATLTRCTIPRSQLGRYRRVLALSGEVWFDAYELTSEYSACENSSKTR
jgi:hypothetical protein